MTTQTVCREIATAGLLLASYPLDLFARQGERLIPRLGLARDPVILAHGLGGSRSNFLAFAAYVRMTGFSNISFFEYSRWQSVSDSAKQLGELIREIAPAGGGAHLIGHSLGGTISRRFAAMAPKGIVRSLITIGSPYSFSQISTDEVAIFGDEDPIVPPPPPEMVAPQMFKRMMVLDNTGHLAILYHPETLRVTATELRINRD
jgi:pimeloyl-ACP methyl ester carboxylesterase